MHMVEYSQFKKQASCNLYFRAYILNNKSIRLNLNFLGSFHQLESGTLNWGAKFWLVMFCRTTGSRGSVVDFFWIETKVTLSSSSTQL